MKNIKTIAMIFLATIAYVQANAAEMMPNLAEYAGNYAAGIYCDKHVEVSGTQIISTIPQFNSDGTRCEDFGLTQIYNCNLQTRSCELSVASRGTCSVAKLLLLDDGNIVEDVTSCNGNLVKLFKITPLPKI